MYLLNNVPILLYPSSSNIILTSYVAPLDFSPSVGGWGNIKMIFSLFADPRAPCDDVNNDILLDGDDNEGMEILRPVIMLKNMQMRIKRKAYLDQNICFLFL